MSKKAIIVSGGMLEEDFLLDVLRREQESYIVGVDKGIEFLYRHGIQPHYIVGDFDSSSNEIVQYYKEHTSVPVKEFNPEKDASDTEIAIRFGMTLGCKELMILGATGGRMDHLWANVQSLYIPFKAGVKAEIVDSMNRIRLIGERTSLKKSETSCTYFSVFPFGGPVYGLTIQGAKYPLKGRTITPTDSLCVSNEWKEEEVVIDFSSGILILMETKDAN